MQSVTDVKSLGRNLGIVLNRIDMLLWHRTIFYNVYFNFKQSFSTQSISLSAERD